jgi:ferredoxin
MENSYLITKECWDKVLSAVIGDYILYAPVAGNGHQDYQVISEDDIDQIAYHTPKPTTPLKTFFLPVKENVAKTIQVAPKRIILGIPSCDLAALDMLDAIYLEEPFVDPYYKQKRDHTILIGTACHSLLEHCHCTTYGIHPYPFKNHDIAISIQGENVLVTINSDKGAQLTDHLTQAGATQITNEAEIQPFIEVQKEITTRLSKTNKHLPDETITGGLIRSSGNEIWKKYAASCVACGACAAICPTCTCFLLIDRPDFEKVRQVDSCQYPAFERVAAGEDPLERSYIRFRNRYMCKYVWKPDQFQTKACTGCGRCIEACIGSINKNDLIHELVQVIA